MNFEMLERRRLLSTVVLGSGTLTVNNAATGSTTTITGGTLQIVSGSNAATVISDGHTLIFANGVKAHITSRGTLFIEGTTAGDTITIGGTKSSVNLNFGASGPLNFPKTTVKRVYVEAGAGKDHVTVNGDPNVPITILGGAGNDVLVGGTGGETLIGGDGNDSLDAGNHELLWTISDGVHATVFNSAQGSLLIGGQGDDTITPSAGHDTIFGGAGRDAVTRFENVVGITDGEISPGDDVDSIEAVNFVSASAANVVQLTPG